MRTPARIEARVWFGILAAPVAWTIEHVFGYGLSEAACDPGGGASTAGFHVGAAVLSGAGALVALAGLVAAISVLRATRSHEEPPPGGRLRLLAAMGVTVSSLLVVLMLMSGAGALAVDGCAIAAPRAGIVRPPSEAGLSQKELGRQLFAGNCSSCHGGLAQGIAQAPPGRGSGAVTGLGPSLRGVGAQALDFYLSTGRMPLSQADAQPERRAPDLSRREIDAIIAYVTSLGPPGPPIPDPHPESGALNSGLHLFTDHCAGCHQVVGRGGIVAGARVPALQDATATQIAEAVRTGPYLMPVFSAKQISDAQLDSIIRYVLSTRHPPDRGGWGIGNVGPIPEGMVTWLLAMVLLVAFCVVLGKKVRS